MPFPTQLAAEAMPLPTALIPLQTPFAAGTIALFQAKLSPFPTNLKAGEIALFQTKEQAEPIAPKTLGKAGTNAMPAANPSPVPTP